MERQRPGNGFSLNKAASSQVNDSYQNYSQAPVENDQIWNALTTEAGRQAVAAQMAVPIRTELDYVGTSRKFFEIDVLAQGQIARYDRDIDVNAYVVSKRGKVNEWTVEGDYVEPNTWEIFSPASIRLSQIQQRRFNILDRTQEKIRIQTQVQEDDQFIVLMDQTASGNIANNPAPTPTTGATKAWFNSLAAIVMDRDLPAYAFLMRFNSFKDLRSWNTAEVDPVTMREILETGLYGQLWGIDLIVSRRVARGVMYCTAEPRFFGVMPIRTEVMLMPNDTPTEAKIGYVGYEEIGYSIVNANGLSRGEHTVVA